MRGLRIAQRATQVAQYPVSPVSRVNSCITRRKDNIAHAALAAAISIFDGGLNGR
jgi:hypothetical protein